MHFHFKVGTTLSVLVLISFLFQLVSLLSVPITSGITLCTYDGYKFGVFGLCSTKTGKCSGIETGYSKTTVDELKGFSLPSNTRHSVSNLLVVHAISTGFTFVLLVMCVLTHFRACNRSLRFLFFLLLWLFVSFLLCLLSFLVDILLFIPHLDWGGWIILASTVLLAMSGTVLCIMRRTASSRNLYDGKRKFDNNNSNNVEMYSMLPLKESYGYVRDDDDGSKSQLVDSDDDDDDDDGILEHQNLDTTDQRLLYGDRLPAQQTDLMRNSGSLSYRGYTAQEPATGSGSGIDSAAVYATSNVINDVADDDEDAYYSYNPMDASNVHMRNARNSLASSGLDRRNSIMNTQQPGVAPYPVNEPALNEDAHNGEFDATNGAPYPDVDLDGASLLEAQTITGSMATATPSATPIARSNSIMQHEPTIPRVGTPPMEDDESYNPQPIKMSPLKGPRPLPESSESINKEVMQEFGEAEPESEEHESDKDSENADEFIFQNTNPFKKPLNNQTLTTFTTASNSTLAHRNLNNIVGQNQQRFVSNTSTVPASSYYSSTGVSDEMTSLRADTSVVDESDASQENDEIPSSDYLDFNEENLSNYQHLGILSKKILTKQASMDSIASSNFTSISQRPVNPRYYEDTKRSPVISMSASARKPHPFRAQVTTRSKEEKLKKTRLILENQDF